MTCPDIDLVLDDGFDVPADVRAHVASCPACSAEIAAALALAAGFAEMRAEAAPASVIDAALAAARAGGPRPMPSRSADRPAAPPTRRRRIAALGLAATAALALALWLRPAADLATPAPEIAQAAPPEVAREPVANTETVGRDETGPPAAATQRADASAPTRDPAVPSAPSPSVSDAPPPAASSLAPRPTTPGLTLPDDVAQAVPDSVAAARDGVLLAFGIVADAQRAAGQTLADEIGRLGTTLSDAAQAPHALSP